jgi:Outer membrane protein beta-barrel domain
MRHTLVATAFSLVIAAPLGAQTRPPAPAIDDRPAVSFRPFFLLAGQHASASTTFKAVFDSAVLPFWGAGVEVAFRPGFFVDVTGSRFERDGQRAFINQGQVFKLNIPLTATITPLEVAAGYRFDTPSRRTIVPYAGAGVGWYQYKETSQFAAAGEDVDTRHVGFQALGGVDVRVHRWVSLAVDASYTHVPGILGDGGLSKEAGESDLGGIAARLRIMVGR